MNNLSVGIPHNRQSSLLIAEDDPVVRLMLVRFLQRHGCQVMEAENGTRAVEIFDKKRPDMVLMDARMPGMDGFDACTIMKERPYGKLIPILMITGLDDDESVDRAFRAGATDFITKPIHWAILRNRVDYLLKSARADKQLHLAAKVLESTTEGIVITDAMGMIQSINPAFVRITGYGGDEAVGARMSLVQSGRHDVEFYRKLWLNLRESNHWQGEIWNRRKSGEVYPQWLTINAIQDDAGEIAHFVGVFADLTAIKESEQNLIYLAGHDALTDLPNRLLFQERLHHNLIEALRSNQRVGVILLDLDRFKVINDTVGHDIGDRILQQVAQRLTCCIPSIGTLARLGGDEFGILFPNLPHPKDAAHVAQAILDAMTEPFHVEEFKLFLGASLGISIYPLDGNDNKSLIKNADAAMYHAKQQGRNNFQFYRDELNVSSLARMLLENNLRSALGREEFLLHYQPQVDLKTGKIIGMEALVRWMHPERGMVSPVEFIPVAEDTGLIIPLGEWILAAACQQTRIWHDLGYATLRVAVNISSLQFKHANFIEMVATTIRLSGLDPRYLELELTESVAMGDAADTLAKLNELNRMGLQLAIDDFGTGFSSLNYLKRFPIHVLKIDQSFVRNCTTDEDDAIIIRSVIGLAHSLNLRVIAEGVETIDQLEFLRSRQCDEIQGYLYSRPLTPERFIEFLKDHLAKG